MNSANRGLRMFSLVLVSNLMILDEDFCESIFKRHGSIRVIAPSRDGLYN